MAGWFDTYAKKSSQRATGGDSITHASLSRRQVLRGATIAGAAWTAPMLMSSPAYAYGVSTCTGTGVFICGVEGTQQACCKTGEICNTYIDSSNTTVNVCSAPGTAGGTCTNNGEGTSGCGGTIYCNGNSSSNACTCTKRNTCGGYGAQCSGSGSAECAPGFVCGGRFCTPACSTSNPCSTTLVTDGALICESNVCRQTCTKKQGCPNGYDCTDGFCA